MFDLSAYALVYVYGDDASGEEYPADHQIKIQEFQTPGCSYGSYEVGLS